MLTTIEGTKYRLDFRYGEDRGTRWTAALIRDATNELISAGIAVCCKKDVRAGLYSKELGRRIALDRAILNRTLHKRYLPRDVSRAIWQTYHTRRTHAAHRPGESPAPGPRPEDAGRQ